MEEIVVTMQMEEEVELTIQLHVPDMQASTREEMVITENISSIVAIAFDESDALIKKVDAILSNQDHENHNGTLKIKVPKRTQTIHFLGNYTKNDIESITSLETLNNFTTTDATTKPTMRYWGMTTFDGSNINQPVTLTRNMAKLTLKTGVGFTPNSCYIAGFVNLNLSGTIVPGGHAVGDTPTIPNNVEQRDYTADNKLGNVYYLFEHANVENNNPLYVIIEVDDKYYKIAFASGDTYFPILRNRAYEITVTEPLDEMYAEADYPAAVNSQYPINDMVITSVPMTVTASPTEVLNQSGQTFTVTVTIPEGITELNVPTHDAFDITPPNGLTPQNGKYIVTPGNNYAFTFTVKEGVEAGNKAISFAGRGKYLKATGSTSIELYDNVSLTVAADPATIYNTAGSTRNVAVAVPQGITTLTIPDATTAEFIVSSTDVTLNNNSCDVSGKQGQTVTFTLALRTDGNVGDPKTVTFNGSGQYKRATGSTTLTLEQTPAQEISPVYELWVENSAWNGSTNYDTFFTRNGNITTGNAANLENTFYDVLTINETNYSADNHKSQAMVMGQDNSISFTIPDTRYLTLLVARNGNAPSIDLQKDGQPWTATSDEEQVPATYNFSKDGDITTSGRLIRYTLPAAGTYTLQGSDAADYLLYYMRVSTAKPTMTDVVQPTIDNYDLSWSGGTYGTYLKETNDRYFVDEEATNFTPTLTYNGLSKVVLSTISLQVVTNVWTFDNSGDSSQGSMQQDTRNYTGEANISSLTYNEGAYTLSGSVIGISETSYKYAAFYDVLQVKSVSFNVKNTVKVALYNSWDGNAQPVTEFVVGGENNILGFKMPQHTLPVNPLNSEKINFTIDSSWQLNETGAGIYRVESSNSQYQIGSQANQNQQDNQSMHYHPRTEWTYKMSWNNIPSNTITPTSTTDDVYFSYNGEISKNPTIEFSTTQGDETPLNITVWTGERALEWSTNYLIVSKDIPIGSVVTLNFTTTGGSFKLHEQTGGADIIALPNVNYGSNSDNLGIISVNSGLTSYSFDVTNEIEVNGKNISEKLNGLAINGTGVTMTSIVVTYPDGYVEEEETVIFEYNFDNGNMNGISGWGNNSSRTIDNNALKLTNPSVANNVYDVQVAIDKEYGQGNYTLTFDIWGSTSGTIQQVFQHYYTTTNDDGSETTKYDNASDSREVSVTTEHKTVTLNNISVSACNRFLFNIGKFAGDIYIDNLKLVKND